VSTWGCLHRHHLLSALAFAERATVYVTSIRFCQDVALAPCNLVSRMLVVGYKLSISALLALAACSLTRSAHAEAARLAWNAPPGCPPETALRAEVARLLGEATVEGGGFDATADVTAEDAAHFTLVLRVRTAGGAGTRTLNAQTCDSLLNVAAFSIALAVNPDLATAAEDAAPAKPREESPKPPAPAPTEPPAAPPVAEPPAQAPPPELAGAPSPPPELWFGARFSWDSSLMPSPAYGAGVTADTVLFEVLRLGLAGQVFLPQKELLSSGTGGYFTLWTLEGHACYEVAPRAALALCPLVQWGVMHGSGRGVALQLEQTSTFFAPGAALLARVPLAPPWAVVLGMSALVPLSHDKFVVNAGQVHEIPSFSAQGLLGVEGRAF